MWKPLITCAFAVLALTGCASGTTEEPAPKPTAQETAPAPLVAEETAPEASTPEAAYLELVRQYENRDKLFAEASDTDLIAAGEDACQQLSEGKDLRDVRVVQGEEPDTVGIYGSSSAIAGAAQDFLCPAG